MSGSLIHITYLHNWIVESLSQDYNLASHITYVVCGNFIQEWLSLQFKVDSRRLIFEKLLMAIYYFAYIIGH